MKYLLVFVDHEAPEPVAVIRIIVFRVKGKHAKANRPVVRIDCERTRNAGVLFIRFLRFFQRIVIRSNERLVLAYGKRKHGLAIFVIDGFKLDVHVNSAPSNGILFANFQYIEGMIGRPDQILPFARCQVIFHPLGKGVLIHFVY